MNSTQTIGVTLRRLISLMIVLLSWPPLAAHGQEGRQFPLGPIGGYYSVSGGSSLAVVRTVDADGAGATAGLQVGDYIYGAFGQVFTPTGGDHYGVTQELGFAVDRAEAGDGTLPLMVMRPGTGALTLNVALSAAGAFGPVYPRNSAKYAPMYETAVADLHTRAMNGNGNLGYPTGFAGLCLLGHPNWNDTTGAKPYRLSINKIRDVVINKITNWGYAPTESALVDGSAIPNPSGGPSNWELGQLMMFLSEYYVKTSDSSVSATLQRGAEMCANTVQWWKQPVNGGLSPEYDRVAGMSSHGGVTGDYMQHGWTCGINATGVTNMNGLAFARRAGANMEVRPKDGHYFGFNVNPGDPIPAGVANALPTSITLPQYAADPVRGLVIQNTSSPLNRSDASDPFFYNPSLAQKFLMQMNFICRRSMANGMVRYSPEGGDDPDSVRTAGALLGMSLYQQDVGGLDSADLARLESMKQRITTNYMAQQTSHLLCFFAGQAFQSFCAPFLSDRQQRYSLDNWRFYYALSRTANNGYRYFQARGGEDAGGYQDNNLCASINIALPYGIANGGYSLIPAYNTNRTLANFKSPFLMWPSLAARTCTVTAASQAFQVDVCDGNGNVLAPSSYTATWSHVSGPATATFSSNSSADTTITFPTVSTTPYRVRLTITRAGVPDLVEDIDITRASATTPVPPSIATHPAPQTTVPGGSASFNVTMSGTGPFVYQWRLNGVPYWTPTPTSTLSLTNVGQGAVGSYDCVITTPTGTLVSNTATLTINAPLVRTPGGLRREVWNAVGGGSVGDLTANSNFPYFPSITNSVSSAEAPLNTGDSYGQKLSGWVKPPISGPYKFYLTGDNTAQIWLSTDDNAINKVMIADLNYGAGYRSYSTGAQSAMINLVAGQKYYIEILHKEGDSGDHVSVGWQMPGEAVPANGSEPIPGVYLEYDQYQPLLTNQWKFDEASGASCADSAGTATATLFNNPVRVTGISGNAISLNGTNQYAQATVNVSETVYAMSLWFRTTQASGGLFSVVDGPTSYDRSIYLNAGNISSYIWSGESISTSGTNYADGQWHHVVHTFGGAIGGQKIYVDGVQVAAGGKSQSDFNWQTAVKIGHDPHATSPYFNGQIDDVRIYNAGLGVADAVALYAAGANAAPQMNAKAFTISEGVTAGTTVGTMTATDASPGQTLSYSIAGGNIGNRFAINSTTGEITVSGTLDYESTTTQILTITASDNGTPAQSVTATATITITNANEAPYFASNPVDGPPSEVGLACSGTISATDPESATVTFTKISGPSWLSVASNGALGGTPATGDVGLNSFTIRASDGGLTTDATLQIYVAANCAWINSAGGSWPAAGNWAGGSVANGQAAIADFSTLNLTANAAVTLDGVRTIGGLRFGDTTPSHNWTLNTGSGGPLTLQAASGAPAIAVNNQTATINAVLAGTQGLSKTDAGTLVLNGANSYTGATAVNAGALVLTNTNTTGVYAISSGAVLELNAASGARDGGATVTISGTGTLRKTGAGTIQWGGTAATFALGSGSLIDVQGGTLIGGSNANEVWTNNLADLNVAAGAIFSGVEANVRVDALTGSGTIKSGYGGAGYANFTFGVNNGSGTFSGVLANDYSAANFIKAGTGTQTLGGANTYTGTTTVSGGALLVNGSLANTPTTIAPAGTLGGSGAIAGAVTNNGSIAPGSNGIGNFTVNNAVTLAPSSAIVWQVANWSGAAGTGWDKLTANSLNITATSNNPVVIRLVDLALANFSEASTSFLIAQTNSGITGFSASKFVIDTSALTLPQGTWAVQQAGNNLVLVYTRSNTAPVFTADPFVAGATEDLSFNGSITANDPDPAESLTYSKVAGPAWLNVAPNGALSGTPGNSEVGLNNFTVSVTDSLGAQDTAELQITVANTNDAPVFTADPINLYATQNTAFTGQLAATDVDSGTTLTYTKVSGPAWLSVSGSGALSGTPAAGDVGPNAFVVRVTDGSAAYDEAALNISVASLYNNGTWANATGGCWPTFANWIGNVFANGADRIADFSTLDLAANATVTLDGARTIGSLVFGDTTPSHNWTLNAGSGGALTLDVASGVPAIAVNNQTTTINVVLAGTKGLSKTGTGTLILSGTNSYTGSTSVNAGTLALMGANASSIFAISPGAILELNVAAGTLDGATATYSGTGTLRKAGAGTFMWGSAVATFALGSDSLIDVQGGTLVGGSWGNEVWTNNLADLNVAAGAIFSGVEANVRVDALTGSGMIRSGYGGAGYANFTFGVNHGSGSFSGVLANDYAAANFIKVGSGTQILSGNCSYTGTTSVNGGALLVNGSLANTATTVAAAGTLGGSGTIAGAVTNNGSLAPGNGAVGNLTVNNTVTLATGSAINLEFSNWTGAAGTGWDKLTANALNITATSAASVTIRLSEAALANFTETSASFVIAQTSSGVTGYSADKFVIDASALTTPQGTWAIQQSGNDLVLTYTRSNTTPAFAADPISLAATEDQVFTGGLTANDPDIAETITFTKVSGPVWLNVASNGTLSGTPSNSNVGANNFVVRVTDSMGASDDATLNIMVANVNDAPAFTEDPISLAASEDQVFTGQLAASDIDAGDSLTYSKVSGPAWLNVATNGVLTGTPANGDVGANAIVVRVTDGAGATDDAALNITVANVNDAPVWTVTPITKPNTSEGFAYVSSLANDASDEDAGDTLTFSKVSGPAWLNVASDGALSGTPGSADAGANVFTVRVTDAVGASADATLNITVLSNDGVWTNLAGGTWPAGSNWSGGTIANGMGKTADFSTLNLTADAAVTLDGGRTVGNLVFDDTTASHNWTLNAGSGGVLTLDVASGGTPAITVNNQTATIGVPLAGTKGLRKNGTGALALTASNLYSGTTTVANTGVTNSSTAQLILGNSAGQAILGDLTVGTGSTGTAVVHATAANQLSATQTVNFNTNATEANNWNYFKLLGNSQVVAGLQSTAGTGGVVENMESEVVNTHATLTLGGSGTYAFNGYLRNKNSGTGTGVLSITKSGSGTQTLSGTITYTGTTTVSGGTLVLTGPASSPTYPIASGSVLELNAASGTREGGATANFSGAGTIRKTGAGTLKWGATAATFALGSGSLIDVQEGTLVGGSSANEVWTNNFAGLNVAAGAIFSGVEANVRVDVLSGAGTIKSGYPGAGYAYFTFGVNHGSGTFSGVLANDYAAANFIKTGTGTQTLSGANTYTGWTTVNGGTLRVNGSLANGTVTVANGGTLGGSGTLGGATTVQSGGTFAPGSNGIGTLTINNTLSLSGTAQMEISKSGSSVTADKVSGVSTLTYGGTLSVTHVGPDALVAGNTFQLFSATTYSGSFITFNLPALGAGLAWDTSRLVADGTIAVVSTAGSGLPAGWTKADIGSPTIGGTSSESGGVYTLAGSGTGFANGSDQAHFIWQTLSGDGEVKVRLSSMSGGDATNAIAGVMIRESTLAGSRFAFCGCKGDGSMQFIRRLSSGGNIASTTNGTNSAPVWVRLVRTGNTITASKSTDGTTWTTVGTDTVSMASQISIGIAVASGNTTSSTTAACDNVTIVP